MTEPPMIRSSLPELVEQRIKQRTWGRVRDLSVKEVNNAIVVQGATATYYEKQLAIEAVMEALEGMRTARVSLDINVRPGALPMSRRSN